MIVLSLLFSLDAAAQDCRALPREIAKATPTQASVLFVQLADCDAAVAKRVAPTVMPQVLPDEGGQKAAVAAVRVGADAQVTTWIQGLQPDDRARVVRALGDACNDSTAVQRYFVTQASALGEDFWTDRWYRALGACSAARIQELLSARLDRGLAQDRALFFGVLEAYARSAGAAAIPRLGELAQKVNDAEAEVNIIAAFPDAANVGAVGGMDDAAAKKAVRTIVSLAPELSPKAVEQARLTLQTLGAELESDQMAAIRYKDAKQDGDTFLWGLIAVEDASCKGGKKPMQRFHSARVIDRGNTWADQLLEKAQTSAETVWTLDLAERCKVEGETRYFVPDAPFADAAAWQTWVDTIIRDNSSDAVKKPIKIEEEPIRL